MPVLSIVTVDNYPLVVGATAIHNVTQLFAVAAVEQLDEPNITGFLTPVSFCVACRMTLCSSVVQPLDQKGLVVSIC